MEGGCTARLFLIPGSMVGWVFIRVYTKVLKAIINFSSFRKTRVVIF
jgi:hypothetical protein